MNTKINIMTTPEFIAEMRKLSHMEFWNLLKKHYAYRRKPGRRKRRDALIRDSMQIIHCGLAHENCQACHDFVRIQESKIISKKQFDKYWPFAKATGIEWFKAAIVQKVAITILPRLLNENGMVEEVVNQRFKKHNSREN